PGGGHGPLRLLALDPRAVVREGMRRDRDLPIRTASRRLADLLDGNGVRLAQAALEGGDGEDAPPPAAHARVHHRRPVEQRANNSSGTDVARAPAGESAPAAT